MKTSESESDSLSSDAEYKKLKEAKLKEEVNLKDLEDSSSDVTSEQATELDKG